MQSRTTVACGRQLTLPDLHALDLHDVLGGPQQDGWDILAWVVVVVVGLVMFVVLMGSARRVFNRLLGRLARKQAQMHEHDPHAERM